jgi:HK97 family phage portal protein
MNLGFIDWVKSWFNTTDDQAAYFVSLMAKNVYKKLAIESCVDLISGALVQCEFKTFEKSKSIKKDNYYLWNVAPNLNQSAAEFRKKMIHKLLIENECLIVMARDKLLIADGFNVDENVMKDSVYTEVTVDSLQFTGSFYESNVIHLKLNDKNIMQAVNSFYQDYGKLIASSQNIYKRSNAKRFLFKGDFLRSQVNKEQAKIDQMMNDQFKPFLEADNAGAIFSLQKGYELEDVSGNGKTGQNTQDSRDIRNLVDDVFDFIGTAFHIPRGLVKGDVVNVSDLTNNFLMFCINPLADLIVSELNKKIFTKDEYLTGSHITIDTTKIQVTTLSDQATALDKLFAIGALSINDVIQAIGGEPINEDWANRRYVTKNYIDASQNQVLEGGDSG